MTLNHWMVSTVDKEISITLAELAKQLGVSYRGDGGVVLTGIATLRDARPGQLSFLDNVRYRKQLPSSKASVVILAEEYLAECPTHALISDTPYVSYAQAASIFIANRSIAGPGVHKTAVVDPSVNIPSSAKIGPYAVVGANVTLGEDVELGAHCVLYSGVKLGRGSRLWSHVTLGHDVVIGERNELYSGVVIGADGFGFAESKGAWHKIPQGGSVVLGDDVVVGANTTIDRGSLENTVIGQGVKLDNQVQIGHNVTIGDHTVIAGCTGIAGSTHVGKYCQIGGACAITGHIHIADRVGIAGMSGISKSITQPGHYVGRGMGVQTMKAWQKSAAILRNAETLLERVKQLEKQVKQK
jgi:UDP-3-O-[3-hydroxymyristoyl] glucosamine N-acyltransferase